MIKRILSMLILLTIVTTSLFGCGSTDFMDDFVDDFVDDYSNNFKPNDPWPDIDDTLQLILDNYVSGLSIPSKDDIDFDYIDPADTTASDTTQDDQIDTDPVDTDADTEAEDSPYFTNIADLKQYLLDAIAATEPSAEFRIDKSIFDFDVLYDIVFTQIYEEAVLDAMGMTQYLGNYSEMTPGVYTVCIEFVHFDNEYSLDVIREMKKDSLLKAKQIIRDLDLANKSEYDIVYAVNEYLCDNCVYPDKEPYSNESHTIYGALIERSAVCEGYAKTAQLIFELCGLDSYYVVGDTPAGGHAWNLVNVEGNYYQLDITWNDSEYQPNGYFLVTDDYMKKSRVWDTSRYPASSTKSYN